MHKVGEKQLVDLLEKFSQHTQKKTTIKVFLHNNVIIYMEGCVLMMCILSQFNVIMIQNKVLYSISIYWHIF